MPLSVVSIGVAYKGDLIAGVIYDPFRDEMFYGLKGCGSYVNSKRLSVSSESTVG